MLLLFWMRSQLSKFLFHKIFLQQLFRYTILYLTAQLMNVLIILLFHTWFFTCSYHTLTVVQTLFLLNSFRRSFLIFIKFEIVVLFLLVCREVIWPWENFLDWTWVVNLFSSFFWSYMILLQLLNLFLRRR